MKRTVRETVFFVLLFVLFFLAVELGHYWSRKAGINETVSIISISIIYTLVMVGVYFLANLQSTKEGFWDIPLAATCGNSPYFWQGGTEEAKACRELASTPEGRCEIGSFSCAKGLVGRPGLPFIYTPISDDSWQSERCDDKPACGCTGDSLCKQNSEFL